MNELERGNREVRRVNESRMGPKGAVRGTTWKTTCPRLVGAPETALRRRRRGWLSGVIPTKTRCPDLSADPMRRR